MGGYGALWPLGHHLAVYPPPYIRGLKKRGVHLALRNAYFDNIIDACEAGTLFLKRKVLSESDEKNYFPMASPWALGGAGTRP